MVAVVAAVSCIGCMKGYFVVATPWSHRSIAWHTPQYSLELQPGCVQCIGADGLWLVEVLVLRRVSPEPVALDTAAREPAAAAHARGAAVRAACTHGASANALASYDAALSVSSGRVASSLRRAEGRGFEFDVALMPPTELLLLLWLWTEVAPAWEASGASPTRRLAYSRR